MQKVISINLNGNAYQLDESGYDALREYLAGAERQLAGNPDRAEILADLEQAVADKCRRYLGPHKSVVTAAEIDRIVAEMGPVGDVAAESGEGATEGAGTGTAGSEPAPRRLYRISEGAMIGGVSNGLAAYFGIDVTIVRILFVLTALVTQGVAIIAYLIMMFVVPEAKTAEERAAAGGAPLSAKAVIDRAKDQYSEGRRQWQRYWRQRRHEWRRYGWAPGMPYQYGPPPAAAMLLPLFSLVHVALFLVAAAIVITLVNTGGILGWQLPPELPVWAGVLIVFVAYQIVVAPIRALRQWTRYPQPGVEPAVLAFWNAVALLAGLAVVVWVASNHMTEIREFLQRFPELVRDFAQAIRLVFRREAAAE